MLLFQALLMEQPHYGLSVYHHCTGCAPAKYYHTLLAENNTAVKQRGKKHWEISAQRDSWHNYNRMLESKTRTPTLHTFPYLGKKMLGSILALCKISFSQRHFVFLTRQHNWTDFNVGVSLGTTRKHPLMTIGNRQSTIINWIEFTLIL